MSLISSSQAPDTLNLLLEKATGHRLVVLSLPYDLLASLGDEMPTRCLRKIVLSSIFIGNLRTYVAVIQKNRVELGGSGCLIATEEVVLVAELIVGRNVNVWLLFARFVTTAV